ncbi:MAG TPA: tRNA glutamyl-Q(34) synthetase GluQRS [Verrucomicrobiae bacterium]|jgi:glutamyl-tRNA synthetase|nr:tRNA glutamyl-Q(34) synthetase GluQRS [Verrucomicrobiae bacterium]
MKYRGRLAPSPTGLLHLGHAQTFWIAWKRARAAGGSLILRNEDLDRARCRPEFVTAMLEDLRWLGLDWDEGPYAQSERLELYRAAFRKLKEGGFLYPCRCSRGDVLRALQAPHAADEEPIYPGTCRPSAGKPVVEGAPLNWRFRVPDGREITFLDGGFGKQTFVAGRDFGDFVVWRHDDAPSYQLAVVTDDAAMEITEVVRGADLLVSTARQCLLYEALGWKQPAFFHAPLVTNENGVRLAKRDDAWSIRARREQGMTPENVRAEFKPPPEPGRLFS